MRINDPAARLQGIKNLVNTFYFVIPAKAGIQRKRDWIPHQVRNDRNKETL
jgi:hypothetical protein